MNTNHETTRRLVLWAALGFFVMRFALMVNTFHGDLAFIWAIPSTEKWRSIPQFYHDYANRYPNFYRDVSTMYYPPASLVFVMSALPALRGISPSLQPWLEQMQTLLLNRRTDSGLELYQHTMDRERRGNVHVLKLPYLIIDAIVLLLVLKLSPKPSKRSSVAWWIFNPLNLYVTFMMGQIDILMVLLVLVAIWSLKRSRLLAACAFVGAVMVKTYPVVLLLPLVLLGVSSLRQKLKVGLLLLFIFVFANIVFALSGISELRAAYIPSVIVGPLLCSLRPDALYQCGKLLVGVVLALWGSLTFMRWSLHSNKTNLLFSGMTFTLCVFYATYRGVLFNHYLLLTPFFHWAWIRMHKTWAIAAFYSLVFLSFIYVKPLLGDLFVPTESQWLMNIDLRSMVSGVVNYEHIALLTRISLDLLLFVTAIRVLTHPEVFSLWDQ